MEKSHPTWVRGLKLVLEITVRNLSVAPYVGAWIETDVATLLRTAIASHPTWVRGLKLPKRPLPRFGAPVAPYVGAWIETPQP